MTLIPSDAAMLKSKRGKAVGDQQIEIQSDKSIVRRSIWKRVS